MSRKTVIQILLLLGTFIPLAQLQAQTGLFISDGAVVTGQDAAITVRNGNLENRSDQFSNTGVTTVEGTFTNLLAGTSANPINLGDVIVTGSFNNNGGQMLILRNLVIPLGTFNNVGGILTVEGITDINGDLNHRDGGLLTLRGDLLVTEDIVINSNSRLSPLFTEADVVLGGNYLSTRREAYAGTGSTWRLTGNGDQEITNNGEMNISGLVINGNGLKTIRNDVNLTALLRLSNGLLQMGNIDTLIITDANAVVEGGNLDSYFNGIFYQTGTTDKYYPVGKNGTFGPVFLTQLSGQADMQIGIEMFEPNPGTPRPGFELLGISDKRYWQFDERTADLYDSAVVTVDLIGEDTTTIEQTNPLDVKTRTIAIAESDSSAGEYNSIGNAMVADDFITSEFGLRLPFFAIALAPTVPEGGLIYIPSALSPRSSDPEDHVFKIYGEKITPENFAVRVFNKWGQVVYETEDFREANRIGWDGTHFENGTELPAGVYTYLVQGIFENGNLIEEVGTVTLIR